MLRYLFLYCCVLSTAVSQSLSITQVAKTVSRSVVLIKGISTSGESLGSGFIISRDGKIATNLHVIRDLKTCSVQLANGDIFDSISVIAVDQQKDLGAS